MPIVIPITDKKDSSGKVILDGNVLLGNITCVSKARLGDYITDLTPAEMKAVDEAISLSLDINHYYQTLQNMYNDKLDYINKLNHARSTMKSDLASKQQQIDELQKLLEDFQFTDINSLREFLENSRKDK